MNNIKNYGPFQLWVLNNFPFTIDDWDSITQYQMLCKCLGALKEQLDVNSDLYKKIQDIENYLANLDLQEEVDHKLDEMAEDGTLQEIIAEYLNTQSFLVYDNLEDLKNATNIINGSKVKTLGYYNINDGGEASYVVREVINTDDPNDMDLIALNDENLVAEIIVNKELNINQFGAKNDDETDNYAIFQHAINYCKSNNLKLIINKGTYLINSQLNIEQNNNDNFDISGMGINNESILHLTDNLGIFVDRGIINIKNITLKGNGENSILQLGTTTLSDNNDSIHWGQIKNIYITNCNIGILLGNLYDMSFDDVEIMWLGGNNCYGIKSLSDFNISGAALNNISFNRLHIEGLYNNGYGICLDSYPEYSTDLLFNETHIETHDLRCKLLKLVKCNEFNFNVAYMSQINNDQNIDNDYTNSLEIDNCRNVTFYSLLMAVSPQHQGTSFSNKMMIFKNNIDNVSYNNCYINVPYNNATNLTDVFDITNVTRGYPIINKVFFNSQGTLFEDTTLSLNRINSNSNNTKFSMFYGNDDIIRIMRNLDKSKNYSQISKYSAISGYNQLCENIITSIVPHINTTIESNNSHYQTVYGRNNFYGACILVMKYNNHTYLCIFTTNVPTSGEIKISVNMDSIFSNTAGTSGKVNIYVDGVNLVIQNKLAGDIEISLLPIFANLL